jgi:hypothetical protein
MTPQSTFMITATIKPDQQDALKNLIATINDAPGFADAHNTLIPFWQFSRLHVARFTILEARTNDDIKGHGEQAGVWPPTLSFMGDIDGEADTFLAELVIRAEPGLRQIFSHCAQFDPAPVNLLEWLHAHSQRPDANYVNWRGRTVRQIHEEQALSQALGEEVRHLARTDLNNRQIWRHLKRFTQSEIEANHLSLTAPASATVGWRVRNLFHLIAVPVILLVLSPLFLLASPVYFWRLRALERSDPENTQWPDRDHLQVLSAQEDVDVTNHFNVFGQVKPGRLRQFTIRMGLLLLDYTSRHIYKRGFLTRIQTIHFARWVLLDNGRRVFFASNYDGSADSYMDDFINKVAWGLNLVFSNGVGYPRSRWLIKGGAENEGKYKKTLRRNQLPSESWYKAYPGLTAVDLARNSRIRQGLGCETPGDQQLCDWLALL